MEKETKKKIMLWTLGIIFIMGIVTVFLGNELYDEEYIEEVKCYDRFSNEIEGLICTEEKTHLSILSIGGFVIIGISELIFMMILFFYDPCPI